MYEARKDGILLRDMIKSDIDDYLRWETEETEWQLWDAPWEYEDKSAEERAVELAAYRETLRRRVEADRALGDGDVRHRLEICLDDADDPSVATHIGGLGSYLINDEFNISEDGRHRAIGIDICDMRARGKGFAVTAMCLFIEQLRAHGLTELYCQTWSGNDRMVGLANRLGFEECCRKVGIRRVRGCFYDGLTFRLDL